MPTTWSSPVMRSLQRLHRRATPPVVEVVCYDDAPSPLAAVVVSAVAVVVAAMSLN